MGGLAIIAKGGGHRVTGCDANVYPPMSVQLASQGIELFEGYGKDQLSLAPDLWLVGNVVSRGNPLMEGILDRGDRYISGPQWLAENVLGSQYVLAVAGTHGKTTTASMLAWVLESAGLDPGFLIGGVPRNFGTSARPSNRRHFVIEADEYDTAFFDKRSKFVHYSAKIVILNNIEFDHADIFADLAAIETQFHHFVRIVPSCGRIIANGMDEAVGRVLTRGCWTPVERFGVPEDWDARPVDASSFQVFRYGKSLGKVAWDLLGDHNRLNALATIAAADAAGVEPALAMEALSKFENVKRRMELRGTVDGVAVYDDFAHHPTAIATTIEGLRRRVGKARILAVLEPRSNTMKQGVMKDRLAASLAAADRVFCYSANLGWDPALALAPLGDRVHCLDDLDRLVAAIVSEAGSGDHVLVMSNGGFGGIHERILNALAQRSGAET